jgi:hypothetical protein
VGYDYRHSALEYVELTEGIRSDNRYVRQWVGRIETGELFIADLGFFCLEVFHRLQRKGAYFLSRFLVGTRLYTLKRKSFDMAQWLDQQTANTLQREVIMGSERHPDQQVQCRFIALRVPEPVAKKRRQLLAQQSRKRKSRRPSRLHQVLCEWTLLVTNVPASWLPAKLVWPLYRIRWQVELLFKQLKSVLQVDVCRTTNPHRFCSELYGKMSVAVLCYGWYGEMEAELYARDQQEISFQKLFKRFQQHAGAVLQWLLTRSNTLFGALLKNMNRWLATCLRCRQPSRCTALQLLEALDFTHLPAG